MSNLREEVPKIMINCEEEWIVFLSIYLINKNLLVGPKGLLTEHIKRKNKLGLNCAKLSPNCASMLRLPLMAIEIEIQADF
jgi:hypothetical protein